MSTHNSPGRVLCLDFDGVILESVSIKDDSYWALFKDLSDSARDRIRDAHRENPGITRADKVRRLFEMAYGHKPRDDEVDSYTQRYAALVETGMQACRPVRGVIDFLEQIRPIPLYVASAAPEDEIRRYAGECGFADLFKGIYGSPRKKKDVLRMIAAEECVELPEVVFVGDRPNDFAAARDAGAIFVGRVPHGGVNPFPCHVPVIEDFKQGRELLCSAVAKPKAATTG